MLAGLFDGLHSVLKVAGVVQCVEDTENVHAVLGGLVDEAVNNFIVVVAVTQQVLATKQHLETGVRQQFAESAQALPRILVEEANAGVEGCSAPALCRPVAGCVDVGASVDHVFHCHSGSHQALMGVAKRELGDSHLARRCDLNFSVAHVSNHLTTYSQKCDWGLM